MMSDRDEIPAKQDDLVTRRIGDQTIIVPVKDGAGDLGSIFTLNELGTRVWQMIDGATSRSKIADMITAEYEVTRDQAGQDVAEFLSSLRSEGLIQPSRADDN